MKLYKVMHALHLYTGLFLWPWMLVYATSGFILNHGAALNERFGHVHQEWRTIRETTYDASAGVPSDKKEQGALILRELNLEGPHSVKESKSKGTLYVYRTSATGSVRVIWNRATGEVTVQKRGPFSGRRFINFLHYRHGYQKSYFAYDAWAFAVDAVVITMWLWALSGLYLWWGKRSRRLRGGITAGCGLLLFLMLVYLMSC